MARAEPRRCAEWLDFRPRWREAHARGGCDREKEKERERLVLVEQRVPLQRQMARKGERTRRESERGTRRDKKEIEREKREQR